MEEYKQTIEEVKKVTEADPDTGLSSQEDFLLLKKRSFLNL
ncbi:hypothetical protein [Enterococcus faecium]|nr:hypothetical protein [Enterococcus faecium]